MRWKRVSILAVLTVFVAIFMIQSASASFVVTNYSFQTSYKIGDKAAGWVNIQFTNESLDNDFRDSFDNAISLEDLLVLNADYNYSLDNSTNEITSGTQVLYFDDADFDLPINETQTEYEITLDGDIVLTQNINVVEKTGYYTGIQEKQNELETLKTQINDYPFFLRSNLNLILNVSGIESKLAELNQISNSSSTNVQAQINDELGLIEIPQLIVESEAGNGIPFISSADRINLDLIQSIGGGNYSLSTEEDYRKAILIWNEQNLNPQLNYKKISGIYGMEEKNLLSYVEISINQRPSSSVFLVVDNLDTLLFDQEYGALQEQGYYYIDFNKAGNKIIFSTSEDLDITDLPLFISPSLDQISQENLEVIDSDQEKKISRGLLIILVSILLIIIFVIAYVMLKIWYDKKYEDYLFKDKNQLYNLITYINGAKKRGVNRDNIEKSLKRAKWSGEQIRYIMRKYAGKRTGLWTPKVGMKKSNPKNI